MSAVYRASRRRRRVEGDVKASVSGRRRVIGAVAGLFLAIIVLGLVAAAGIGLYTAARYRDFVSGVQPPEELLASLPRGGARIYDRDGNLLYEFVDQYGGLRRPVPLSEISPWLIDATVATEDASFWENSGLNVRGLARAGWENFSPFGGDVFQGSGGSSITQQLAKTVYIPPEERLQRSVERKLKEAAIALELTTRYPKEQVLEWYLNSISYGGVYVGIEAASQGYFGKPAADLTLAEASLLAGVPQQPVRYDPLRNPQSAKARQAEVLDLMVRHNRLTAEEAQRARSEPLTLRQARFDIEAPHFVLGPVATELAERFGADALYRQGLEVTTTLDMGLQKIATDSLEKWIREYEAPSRGHNGAFYALDPKTAQVLVYVGSRDYFNDDIQGRNDNIMAINSPGSTLKPFTYMTAFQKGWSTGTGVFDVPTKIKDASTGEDFTPVNPINSYAGIIPADKALGNSLNVTALRTIIYAGVPQTLAQLRAIGFTTLNSEGGYGPALTLGGVDVTLQDLTYAYSVLAAGGAMRGQEALVKHLPGERQLDPVNLLKVTNSEGKVLYEYKEPVERRIVSEGAAYLVTSIISDGNNQCITFGACGAIQLPDRPSAQKTGTSEPYANSKDIGETWAVGYTPHLVAGVWFGNSDNARMVNILSTSVSWRAWRDFMTEASKAEAFPATAFQRPAGVVERELCFPSGKLPGPNCPKEGRYRGLFAAEVLGPNPDRPPDALYDTWWQKVGIDMRTGLLAAPGTPAQFIREDVRLVLPKEETAGWNAFEWASKVGLAGKIASTELAVGAANLVQITSPSPNQRVTGSVSVLGRVATPDFKTYRLEYGVGQNPSSWLGIVQSQTPVSSGELSRWDTTNVPDGEYTLRVQVEDAKLGPLFYMVPVIVANRGASSVTPTPTVAGGAVARIASPVPGVTIGGVVQVEGTASGPRFQRATVELGRGISPSSWETIQTLTQPVSNGSLATWNTQSVPDGIYIIKLTMYDSGGVSTAATTVVTVKNGN
ncbi:MAG: transglycosylase domain-containing protein [Dehalococcoidia bacterium]|nr:transglycosylase domain-containing protein [Dehalococcoidia bacterium]